MDNKELKNRLIESLGKVYYMEGFNQLVEFLQGELYVLQFLSQNQDMDVSPSILSDRLHMSRPRITAALTTLRKKGYVVTEDNEEDRRRITVLLTQEGQDFILGKQGNVDEYFHLFVAGLGEKNTLELIRLINLGVEIFNSNKNE